MLLGATAQIILIYLLAAREADARWAKLYLERDV